MKRYLFLAYGWLAYASFFGVFLYFIGFVGDLLVPKSVNTGPSGGTFRAVLVDIGLIALFAFQHLVMARKGFKRGLRRILPEPLERSTFVLASNFCLAALMLFWQPIPLTVWEIESTVPRWTLHALSLLGWLLVLYSSFLIDHFDLFGLRQVSCYFRNEPCAPVPFKIGGLYRYVRHPMMLGFLLAYWCTPVMTLGHLVLAAGFSVFIVTGLRFEERDLVKAFGAAYGEYRSSTGMLIPMPWKRVAPSREPDDRPGASPPFECLNDPC
ncbi:MAG: methanethiol S-methyltransferase [Syntrophobacteraceae bacterium]